MNKQQDAVDPDALLLAVARAVPRDLLGNITIVGSIASAWAFRGLAANALVATKDVDLLLTPSLSAVGTAVAIGDRLMAAGWTPIRALDAGILADAWSPLVGACRRIA